MVKVIQMSLKEADRYAVIQQVVERTIGQSDAALWLGIWIRQVKRLARAVRLDGAQGVVSRRWGVASNRRISSAVQERFVGLVREHYADFGPTLACEYLAAQRGYAGSRETLRGWMMDTELWKAKRSRRRRIHSPREWRSRLGELVQIDGSPHTWFEERAGKCCLIAFIDDATSALLQARRASTSWSPPTHTCTACSVMWLFMVARWRCPATDTASSPNTTLRTPRPKEAARLRKLKDQVD